MDKNGEKRICSFHFFPLWCCAWCVVADFCRAVDDAISRFIATTSTRRRKCVSKCYKYWVKCIEWDGEKKSQSWVNDGRLKCINTFLISNAIKFLINRPIANYHLAADFLTAQMPSMRENLFCSLSLAFSVHGRCENSIDSACI